MPPDTPAAPAAMEGRGVYNRSSQVQATGVPSAAALLTASAAMIPLPAAPAPIVLADYGCAQGRNSLGPVGEAIAALHTRVDKTRSISVFHTDLPENDFSTLFETLRNDPASYRRTDPATFPAAIGRSFYEQLLPSGSVHLGWSAWSLQWLSRAPCAIPDQVQVGWSSDASVRAAFAAQAEGDWRTFLDARARELAPGGRMVILAMAADAQGGFGYRSLIHALYAALCAMATDGFISAEELHRMVIPTVGRTREEFMVPFMDKTGADKMGAPALSIVALDMFVEPDGIWEDFARDGDAARFGRRWAAFSRASVFPSLAAGLDHDDGKRGPAFIARLEADLAAALAAAPEAMPIPLARMIVARD